ncbi:MAG: TlpA family protein disulfide reductase [Selenomonas sp.]|nr:TlpA family protein disulfide reductase [Selenomonas sp.]
MHNFVKTTGAVFLAASVFLSVGCSAGEEQSAVHTDREKNVQQEKFPAFQTKDLAGNTVTQDIFKQKKVTVVNIWGTFCPPCIGEMPELGSWTRQMPADAQLIGIVCDARGTGDKETIAKAVKITSEAKADFVNLLPSEELMKYLEKVEAVPTTIFVDAEGNILGEAVVGANVPQYQERLAGYLK